MNLTILSGRLTANPETRYTADSQMAVSKFTLAVDRIGKEKGTDFIRVVAFGKLGELSEKYLEKGKKVLIQGNIKTGSYERSDGSKAYTTDVICEKMEFLDSKNMGKDDNVPSGFIPMDDLDDSIPF